ncbi:response regulator transcription factor [Eudoraea chungangensis]|uniref:response regulator transcription factor n=1 Tax=Eudoraea chungangensis TaxID=1481905 RepID=UPI0023ED060B|nr:response regulator transcription factor [Eudoraea chungangensis]
MKSNILRIIVIDHDLLFHQAYQYYFETYKEYDLAGIYGSVKDALEEFELTKPDIIVSEVNLPEVNGIDGIQMFRKKDPNVKIIMVSAENDYEVIKNAFKSMVNGYLAKPVSIKGLYHALNSIKYEGAVIGNDIAKKVIAMFQRKNYKSFSERENQIIDYLCQGATYKTIAEKLFVTTSAINFHIQNIYLKLDVNSKSEALNKLQELEY